MNRRDTLKLAALLAAGSFPVASLAGTGATASPGNTFTFVGGKQGAWRQTVNRAIRGEGLPDVERVDIVERAMPAPPTDAAWAIRGFTSNLRYTTTAELEALRAVQPPLGRPEATRAAMIPIRKSAAWWALPQDRRREVFEERSHHTAIGLAFLPAIARKLHHSRDLGEPFDFVTWFEFAPGDEARFDQLLAALRATEEWTWVEREVEVRLER